MPLNHSRPRLQNRSLNARARSPLLVRGPRPVPFRAASSGRSPVRGRGNRRSPPLPRCTWKSIRQTPRRRANRFRRTLLEPSASPSTDAPLEISLTSTLPEGRGTLPCRRESSLVGLKQHPDRSMRAVRLRRTRGRISPVHERKALLSSHRARATRSVGTPATVAWNIAGKRLCNVRTASHRAQARKSEEEKRPGHAWPTVGWEVCD